MSYIARLEEEKRDGEYKRLGGRTEAIVREVTTWVADATKLHSDSPSTAEKDDVLAMRAQFVLDLRTQLGI